MQVTYDGAHSVLIGDFINGQYGDGSGFLDTWTDLHLIPTSRPYIEPPAVRENYVDIPGAHGSTDLTDLLIGRPLYENRDGTLDFYVDNSNPEYEDNWSYAYDKILNMLNGYRKKIILKDSPSYYYEGRLSIDSWKTDKMASTISIKYNLEPFKSMIWSTVDDWLWDPFDFVIGIIPTQQSDFIQDVAANANGRRVVLEQGFMGTIPFIPTIKITSDTLIDMDATYNGQRSQFLCEHLDPTDNVWKNQTYLPITYQYGKNFEADTHHTKEIEIYSPSTTVLNTEAGYKYAFHFYNRFVDPNGSPVPVKFQFVFRPRRL